MFVIIHNLWKIYISWKVSTCIASVHLKEVFKKHQDGTRSTSFCSSTRKVNELRSTQQSYTSAHCSRCVSHLLRLWQWRLRPMHTEVSGCDLTFQRQWRVRFSGSSIFLVPPKWSSRIWDSSEADGHQGTLLYPQLGPFKQITKSSWKHCYNDNRLPNLRISQQSGHPPRFGSVRLCQHGL